MATREIDLEAFETEYVDKFGPGDILDALAEIALGKAEHVASNWQDQHAAKMWKTVARHCSTASELKAIKAATHIGHT